MPNQDINQDNFNNIIGYCKECKETVLITDDYVKNNGTVWCMCCYEVIHNIVEELNFEQ